MISQLIWGIMRHHEASNFCVIKLPDVLSNGFASEHSRPSKRSLKRKKAAAKKAAAKASEMAQHHWNHCPTSGSPKSNNNQIEWVQFQGPFSIFEELNICYTLLYYVQDMCVCPQPPTKTHWRVPTAWRRKRWHQQLLPCPRNPLMRSSPKESRKSQARTWGDPQETIGDHRRSILILVGDVKRDIKWWAMRFLMASIYYVYWYGIYVDINHWFHY